MQHEANLRWPQNGCWAFQDSVPVLVNGVTAMGASISQLPQNGENRDSSSGRYSIQDCYDQTKARQYDWSGE